MMGEYWQRIRRSTLFKYLVVIGAALLIISGVVSAITSLTAPSKKSPQRIAFHEGRWFLVGYNYPWKNYGYDFSNQDNVENNADEIAGDFADLAAHGAQVTRWFLFTDFKEEPVFDAQGMTQKPSEGAFRALDTLLSLAQEHNIYVILDFIDATSLQRDRPDAEFHSRIFTDPHIRQSFFESAIIPVLQRYGQHPNILAWSPMNEPDYVTIGVKADAEHIGIPYQDMRTFMQQFTHEVHTYTRQLATMNNGPLHFTHFWTGLGFDFYSPHYYDWMNAHWPDSDPVTHSADSFNLDKPIVLAELPSKASQYPVPLLLDALYNNGYAGALFWSMNSHDYVSNYEGTKADFKAWVEKHKNATGMVPTK